MLKQAKDAHFTGLPPSQPLQTNPMLSLKQLQGEHLRHHLDYWQVHLAGAPALLELPTDRPRPPQQSYRGDYIIAHLPASLVNAIKALSSAAHSTDFITLYAAFVTLLYRLSQQTDIVVGLPIDNRTRPELDPLNSFFVHLLPLRTKLTDDLTFRAVLEQVRENVSSAYQHQAVPFEFLLDHLQFERELSYAPLTQVTFALQKRMADHTWSDLRVTPPDPVRLSAKFDLQVKLDETDAGEMRGFWMYNNDLFDAETIQRMAGHFETLLRGIVANPEQEIGRLPLLTAAERHQILVAWNDTTVDYPKDKALHQLFEEQATRTPDAVAVVFDDHKGTSPHHLVSPSSPAGPLLQLTYRELNERANQLAHYLQSLGVGPETLVGICMERGIEMVVGLLGILKAGGAYVPLDPTYPQERLAFMLQDADVAVLLTQAHLQERLLPVTTTTQFVQLDSEWFQMTQHSHHNPIGQINCHNLAYVLYTSGSTGQPKGVMIEHRSPTALIYWAQRIYSRAELAGVLASTSICFDLSVFEIFLPLSVGGQVILAENALYLPNLRHKNKVTLVNTVPSAMKELVRQQVIPPSVQTINLAGEPLRQALVDQLYTIPTVRAVYDLYGPSEDTTYSTFKRRQKGGPVTIGKPIDNTQVYILDSNLQPLPIGVAGELHIGGAGLSRGYLKRPQLTAKKFIQHREVGSAAFRQTANLGRLYKTGDLARWLPSGEIEFLGRMDYQVKIHGFRIELGEIEAILAQHPAVRETVVVARTEENQENQEQRLVAYVVRSRKSEGSDLTPHDQEGPLEEEFRHYVQSKLPDYMVPSAFVLLDAMPLTPNGKIDRKALPSPTHERPHLYTPYVAPATETEQMLVAIYSELLGIREIGVNDDFLRLGGHSLLAMQLISRIRSQWALDLPVHTVFERSTVAQLATYLHEQGGSPKIQTTSRPSIRPGVRTEPLPLSFGQERLWFMDQVEGQQLLYNEHWALHLRGQLDVQALSRAFTEIVGRHEILRTTYAQIDGTLRQMIADPAPVFLSIRECTHADAQTIQAEVTAAWQEPFDLTAGPLWRVQLLRTAATEHVLVMIMHHSISDDWSFRIFLNELAAFYRAITAAKPSPLLPLPIQYGDFVQWQREQLQGEMHEHLLAYWREQLDGIPPLLKLPTDYVRPTEPSTQATRELFVIPNVLWAKLQAISHANQTTLFMTLFAAYVTLLYRYTGQDDIVIGVPSAGRNYAEIEPLIGFFVNTLPLRSRLTEEMSTSALLAQVKQTLLDGQQHQALPFEQLVETLAPQRTLHYTPIFQVMFTSQMTLTDQFNKLTDLTATLLPRTNIPAKFDLVLEIEEQTAQLVGAWDYNTALFAPATIARMTGHLITLLTGMADNPAAPLHTLPLLTDAERRQLLIEWNDTAVAHPLDQGVHQLFERCAARAPDAVAVVYDGQSMTYGELNRRANQLAHYLIKRGIGPERIVGICIERSPAMVISLLAIFKAGGAYLPIDATYPQARLAFMVEDADIALLLTQEQFLSQLPPAALTTHRSPYPHRPLVRIDRDAAMIAAECDENPAPRGTSYNLAYLLYTSGSTGEPKGVAVTHRSLTNFTCTEIRRFNFNGESRVLQFAALSFDASLSEICTALCGGGTLYLPTPEQALPGPALAALLLDGAITHVKLPPSALTVLPQVDYPALQVLMTIGEACTSDQIAFWSRGRRFCNGYGPTEGAIGITGAECTNCTVAPPIGRPYDNTQLYVLDAERQPVPIGVAGELYLAGEQIARGYWQRPALNAEKFIPATEFPFAAKGTLYRTGDLVRYLPDGNLDFIGRIDQMVKLRGMRIELGEIETTLNHQANVRESAVLVHEYAAGDQRLVAYVAVHQADLLGSFAQENAEPLRNTLLAYLKQKLPAHMVPAAIVLLRELPKLPNGKLDRKSLPAPTAEDWENVAFVAPRTETEEVLAAIWCAVLKQPQVGIHDNFFALGGHSLLLIELLFRLQEALGIELGARIIFEQPTIAQLAAQIDDMLLMQIDEERLTEMLDELEHA